MTLRASRDILMLTRTLPRCIGASKHLLCPIASTGGYRIPAYQAALGSAMRMVSRECSMPRSIHWSTRRLNRLWVTIWRRSSVTHSRRPGPEHAAAALRQNSAGGFERGVQSPTPAPASRCVEARRRSLQRRSRLVPPHTVRTPPTS